MMTKLIKTKYIRKLGFALLITFISLCIFFPWRTNHIVSAETNTNANQEHLEESIREQLEKLNLDALQTYLDELGISAGKSIVDTLLGYISGANFNYKSFGRELLTVFFSQVIDILPAFACIIAIALLSGLVSMLQEGVTRPSSVEIIRLISYISALIPLITVVSECVVDTVDGITDMQRQMSVVYPVMMTLIAACGSSVTVALCKPAVAFFATTITSILCEIVMPLTLIIMVFSFVGNLTKTLKIGKFTAFFKSVNKWIIGVSISVFGLFFTLQGITAASYDGVIRRAAKYAIGNGIPIVGGFLSGGFDLAVAGSVLIKKSLGSLGIFMMVAVLLEPLLLLISVNVLLRLTAAVTQPMGDGGISALIGETADNLRYCVACLFFVAFLYFLTILIMVCCTEAVL